MWKNSMKKYLIIGGAGFIGSHLSGALLSQGNKVVIIDNSPVRIPGSKVKSYAISIEDAKKVAAVFKKEKPDVVYHLAGPINLRRAISDPFFLKDINFLSRINIVLDVCRKHNVKKFIFTSSGGAIYEDAAKIPASELYPAHPKSLYGLANLAIEKYIDMYCKNNNLDFTIPRLSNVYGPRQWQSGFIPATMVKILKKENPVIYGSGNQTRDFIYIDDAIEALMMLAKNGKNEIYNVGSGQEISLNKIFKLIKALVNVKIKAAYKNIRALETKRSALDVKKIKKEFGWRAKTSLEDGLAKTIKWHKTHANR